jgi:hypothetical protein
MFAEHDHDHPTEEAERVPTRPSTGVCFVGSFEGRSLITYRHGSQSSAPCWQAGEVAAILGLGGASELARRLAIDWAADAREGEHWIRIGELELDELRYELGERGVIMTASLAEARSALLLLEPGLALAVAQTCLRASPPPEGPSRRSGEPGKASAGPRLLAHVRERVIPDVAALGRPSGSPFEREVAAIVRERLELERRRWAFGGLDGLCEALERCAEVDAEVIWAYRVVAAEIALRGELWQLKPTIEHGWLSPKQIARRHLGVSSQRVGQVISLLGLRDSKFHSKAVLNKAAGRERAVVSHLYSPAAVGLIERELKSRGYRRVE